MDCVAGVAVSVDALSTGSIYTKLGFLSALVTCELLGRNGLIFKMLFIFAVCFLEKKPNKPSFNLPGFQNHCLKCACI